MPQSSGFEPMNVQSPPSAMRSTSYPNHRRSPTDSPDEDKEEGQGGSELYGRDLTRIASGSPTSSRSAELRAPLRFWYSPPCVFPPSLVDHPPPNESVSHAA